MALFHSFLWLNNTPLCVCVYICVCVCVCIFFNRLQDDSDVRISKDFLKIIVGLQSCVI